MVPHSNVTVRFGKLDQKRAPKHTILGSLIEAVNVRQRKLGRYEKRYGYSALNRTTDTGTLDTGTGLVATADAMHAHANDTMWTRDETNGLWRNRGAQVRAFPTDIEAISQVGNFPFSVTVSGKVYQFTAVTDQVDAALGAYFVRVFDLATGIELKTRTAIAASGIDRVRAIESGGYAWFFWQEATGTRRIFADKFNPANLGDAPTRTTYFDQSAGTADRRTWDLLTTTSGVAMVLHNNATCTPSDGSGLSETWTSILDPTTGQRKASPGWVAQALGYGAPGAGSSLGPLAWVSYDGTSGLIYFALNAVGANNFRLHSIATSTHAGLATIWSTTGTQRINRSICGYYVATSEIHVFLSDASDGATGGGPRDFDHATMTRYTWNGAAVSATQWLKGEWAASHPFKVGSNWYLVTGHDDFDHAQRSYLCRNIVTRLIVGRAMYGRGGNVFQRGTGGDIGDDLESQVQFHTQAEVSGNKAYMALQETLETGGAFIYGSRFVTWDFAATHGPLRAAVNRKHVIFPGPWAGRMSAQDSALIELVPMMTPPTPQGSEAGGAVTLTNGDYGLCATYAAFDGGDLVYRSGPSPTVSVTISASEKNPQLVVETLRQTNVLVSTSLMTFIEVWMTAVNGSTKFLVARVVNDPTANTATIDILAEPVAGAETLYTETGVLANEPAPPARIAFEHQNRLWLTGTDINGEAWCSKEYRAGDGPAFSAVLKLSLFTGKGRITAGGSINWDYAVVFTEGGAFAITGQGKDDTGGGNGFQALRLSWDGGVTNPNVVSYPGGLMFQAIDGMVYRIGSDLQVQAIGMEAQDLIAGATVTSAEHVSGNLEVRFTLSNGKILVHDYGNANEQAPDGYWYLDESADLAAGVAACVHGGVYHYLEADGEVRKEISGQFFDRSSTPILPKLKLAPLQFADLLGDLRISRMWFLGEFKSTHDLRISVGADGGSATNYDKTVTAGAERFMIRPAGCGRISALDVTVQQTGTNTGEGFWFEGLLFDVQPRAKGRGVESGQRL